MRRQVVIVGGGPVGIGLAVDLGRRGVSCAVVERYLEPQRIPKGQNLTQRTLEHFYFWGIADKLRAARVLPSNYPIGGITAYGSLMGDYWYAAPHREVVRSYYFEPNDRLPQYQMEKVLRNKMAELPTVDSWFGWSADGIEQDESGTRVTITERGGAGRQVLEADYVVGCDGARSTVREHLGIACHGADYDQVMMLAVFRSRALHERLNRFPPCTTYRVLRPEFRGYWQFFGRVDVGESWFFHAPAPSNATTEDDFKQLIWDASGFEFACQFDHVGLWDLRVSIAETYQVGRIFIAGDAAHSHPPYGGYGLNNGLEDVVNLGWKLAAMLEDWGGEKLLTSYSDERRPIFKETGEDFIGGRIEADREFLERYRPDRDRLEFERAWAEQAGERGAQVRGYEPNYEGSPVIAGPPGGVCSAHGTHSVKARAGHHLTPLPLSCGRNVFEELDTGFCLLAFDAEAGAVTAFKRAASALNVPLKVIRDSFDGGREACGARLTLVRPDQYVAWNGDGGPNDPAALLSKLVGRG